MSKLSCVDAYKRRRAKRLKERGYRYDAPEESENNGNNSNNGNNGNGGGSSGGSKGGHGNTRLPFGLCKRFGIDIDPSWTPKDAWEALGGKGITPSGAYGRLKRGEDPGKTDIKPTKVQKSTRVKTDNGEFDKLVGGKNGFASTDGYGWILRGEEVGASSVKRPVKKFKTKTDMIAWMKEQGVQEFTDENNKTINPQEAEIPKSVYKGNGAAYTSVTLGYRNGEFILSGKDYDGKNSVIQTFSSAAKAKKLLADAGVKVEDLKITSEAKKRERERLSWMESDKKEHLEDNGVKFGKLELSCSDYGADKYAPWIISGMDEDGTKHTVRFKSKDDAMMYMKKQGVQKVNDKSSRMYPDVDPQEYTPKGTENAEPIPSKEEPKSGMSDEERAKWKKEFLSKAEWFGRDNKYADISLVSDGTGPYAMYTFYGYDKNGNKKKLTSMRGMNNVVRYIKDNAKYPAEKYIKDERTRKEYEKYAKL